MNSNKTHILGLDDDLYSLIQLVTVYLVTVKGLKNVDIAEKLRTQLSTIYSMSDRRSKHPVERRRKMLVRLLDAYSLNIYKDNEGDYVVLEGNDKNFYQVKFYAFLYDKDSKSMTKLSGIIDVVDKNLLFFKEEMHYLEGEFTVFGDLTRCSVESKNNIYYSQDYKNVRDDAHTIIDLVFNGHPHEDAVVKPILGFYTKKIGVNKLSSGRVVLVKEESEISNDSIMCYLTNDSFHSFIDYNVDIEDINQLDELVERFKEKYKFIHFKIPKEVATAYQQFLIFFVDYVEEVKGKQIKFDVNKAGNELLINIDTLDSSLTMDDIGIYLKEYTELIKHVPDLTVLNVEGDISKEKYDIFLLRLQGQVNNLKQELKIAELKNSFLSNEKDFLRQIVDKFSEREHNIYVQMLNGGEQQFSDKIENRI